MVHVSMYLKFNQHKMATERTYLGTQFAETLPREVIESKPWLYSAPKNINFKILTVFSNTDASRDNVSNTKQPNRKFHLHLSA